MMFSLKDSADDSCFEKITVPVSARTTRLRVVLTPFVDECVKGGASAHFLSTINSEELFEIIGSHF